MDSDPCAITAAPVSVKSKRRTSYHEISCCVPDSQSAEIILTTTLACHSTASWTSTVGRWGKLGLWRLSVTRAEISRSLDIYKSVFGTLFVSFCPATSSSHRTQVSRVITGRSSFRKLFPRSSQHNRRMLQHRGILLTNEAMPTFLLSNTAPCARAHIRFRSLP